eukprot:UN08651
MALLTGCYYYCGCSALHYAASLQFVWLFPHYIILGTISISRLLLLGSSAPADERRRPSPLLLSGRKIHRHTLHGT